MQKIFLFLLFGLIYFLGFSQTISDPFFRMQVDSATQFSHEIGFNLMQRNSSNTLDNAFINGITSASFLNDTLKNNTLSRLKNTNNHFGSQTLLAIYYKQKLKKFNLLVSVGDKEFASASFTKNWFNLVFFGNEKLAGQNVNLGKLDLDFISYQYFTIGIEKAVLKNYQLTTNVGLLKGYRNTELQIANSNIFTETDGKFISFSVNNTIFNQTVVKGNNRLSSFNGVGAKIDLVLSRKFESHQQVIRGGIKDLGLLFWNNIDTYTVDSTYRFDGVTIDNITNFNLDVNTNNISIDSVKQLLGMQKSKVKNTTTTPATLFLNYYRNLGSKTRIMGQVKYITNSNYRPKFTIAINQSFAFPVSVRGTLMYGGFSDLDVGLGLSYIFKDRLGLYFDSFFIEDLISSSNTSSQGIKYGLFYYF